MEYNNNEIKSKKSISLEEIQENKIKENNENINENNENINENNENLIPNPIDENKINNNLPKIKKLDAEASQPQDFKIISSFYYEMIFMYSFNISILYFISELIIILLKNKNLFYPSFVIVFEVFILILYVIIALYKKKISRNANLNESSDWMSKNIKLIIFLIFCCAYYGFLQLYVSLVDIVFSSVMMFIFILEMVFAIKAFYSFKLI